MASAYVPKNIADVMVIRRLTENITTCSAPFARFGRCKIGGRGTIVKLPSGALAVFSPTALTPEVKETVSSMGRVGYIAALDMEHHLYLGPWHEAYPEAKVIAMEGLREKRQKEKNEDVRYDVIFTAKDRDSVKIDEEFDKEFDYAYIPEHGNKELVFNFKRERTLIQADLLFNLPATEQYSKSPEDATTGIYTKIFSTFTNTRGAGTWQKRFIWYVTGASDRPGFNRSVNKLDQWDFDRMIPCHGDVIETGAKTTFRKILQWNLDAAK